MPDHQDHIEQRFTFAATHGSLPNDLKALLEAQKRSWKLLADGYASLGSVSQRSVPCRGFDVILQFNPGRMTSTAAPVDDESIRRRSCFLCMENLPKEQDGMLFNKEFVVLCNPAPIFPHHFTVSHVRHQPQALEPFLGHFFSLAKAIGPSFTVFYNGPKCGASAPDHMHFQICPAGIIPVERDAVQASRREVAAAIGDVTVFTLGHFGRETIVIEGNNSGSMRDLLRKFLESLRSVVSAEEEPMVNVLCTFTEPLWRVIVFPRSKHRPDVFFLGGDGRILVSPAAVDMGGLIITPSERDFDRLDAPRIEAILAEVSLDKVAVRNALARLA